MRDIQLTVLGDQQKPGRAEKEPVSTISYPHVSPHMGKPAGNGHHGNARDRKGYSGDVESQGSGSEDDLPLKERLGNCCRSTCTVQNALGKLPIVSWLPKYRCDTFQSDLIAGLTVGLTVIPQGLAYAQIAGLSPEYGLYSAFMGCFVPWDMTMGIVAIIACILLKKLRTIKYRGDDDPNHEVSLPVKILRKLVWLCGTGANAIVVIVAAAVIAIVDSQGVNIEGYVTVTGNITGGLPPFRLPAFEVQSDNVTMSTSEVFSTLGAGIGIVPLLALVETMAIGKAFARANNYKIQPTQELLAIGTANIVSSFVSSYPITGSFSRTAVNSQSGVRTPLGGVWTGALVILALVVLTPYFYYIPKAALAGVIIAAVIQMVDYEIVRKLWHANKLDLIPLFVTFIGSLTIGIEYGILIGIGVSLLMLLYPIARPKVKYTNVSGALVVTPAQGVNFPAAEHIELKAMEKAKAGGKMRHIILNMEHLSDLDYTAIQSIKSLLADCEIAGMRFILAGGMTAVREKLQTSNIKNLTHIAVREKLQTSNIKNLTHVDSVNEALSELSLQAVDDAAVRGEEADPFISRL
ncbi:sodium-independent sulfate anion transporter [Elysia marginata]|uniref:Sodium-independent sulfate anion transporter n=1 Tax=Elysia marginata TaxID=1093978 RepID=A0AAV4FMX4_9GAST|nr:sodium-independent sulfate anion transporter [Elysia marginata]